jgi:hypothetical protein
MHKRPVREADLPNEREGWRADMKIGYGKQSVLATRVTAGPTDREIVRERA